MNFFQKIAMKVYKTSSLSNADTLNIHKKASMGKDRFAMSTQVKGDQVPLLNGSDLRRAHTEKLEDGDMIN